VAIRTRYEHDLAELQRRTVLLSETVERAIANAVWALMHRDLTMAQRVVDDDTTIDELRYDLEEAALRVMARQQPTAVDLRLVSALMGLASEMERIGDYAEGIAAVVVRSAELQTLPMPSGLGAMAQKAREMLQQATRAVVDRDAGAVARQEQADDEVDRLYEQAVQELLTVMREQPEQSETATYLLWAAHNLERIADRTVNIAERAAFIATGVLGPRRPV
jgi:phosphate transport system protein